jgi:hypothetical protein
MLFALLGVVFALLLWGRIRYDVVAFGALVVAVLLGVVEQKAAFAGFGHPAVIIIALVLVVSRGLVNSGAIEVVARHAMDSSRPLWAHIGIMSGVGAALSAVMNNVGALALLMPVDVQAAAKAGRSPALTLMPLSFATILGGLVTLIGTPPNIIIASFREQELGAPFQMFDLSCSTWATISPRCASRRARRPSASGYESWMTLPRRPARPFSDWCAGAIGFPARLGAKSCAKAIFLSSRPPRRRLRN